MKSTAVDESLSSMNQQFCSRENQLLQMLQQNEKSTQKSILEFQYFKKYQIYRNLEIQKYWNHVSMQTGMYICKYWHSNYSLYNLTLTSK